jgi:hypothetical protein
MPSGGRIVVEGATVVAGVPLVVVVTSGAAVDVGDSSRRADAGSAGDASDSSVACDAHEAASAMTNSADPRNFTQGRR